MTTKPIKKIKENLGSEKDRKTFIKAEYYYDHSGYCEVQYKGAQIFCHEDADAKGHLEYLIRDIDTKRKELEILLKAHKVLEDTIYRMPKPVKDT